MWREPYDKDRCEWWYMPDPPEDSGGGYQARKKPRKRAGKRHRKGAPQSCDPSHVPDADADTSGDEQESRPQKYPRVTSGGMPSLGLGLVCVATLPTMVRGVEMFSPATVIGVQ